MSRVSLLRDLHDGTDRWTIVVRVLRKWNVYQKSAPSELFCTTMILVDEEGTKIQSTIMLKHSNETFHQTLDEGKIYFLTNFVVSQNSNQYRATTHNFKIILTQQTFAHAESGNIPLHAYSFLSIPDILKSQERNFADYLIDIVAFVRNMGSLEEYRKDNETKNKLRMILIDIDDGVAEIPTELLVQESANPIKAIVLAIYSDLEDNLASNQYFNDRAILAPTIEMVSQINDYMCSILPGQAYDFLSCDTVCKSTNDSDCVDHLYTTEFLNSLTCSGLPPHKLTLKVGVPVMLLRNIDQSGGLCNGTRLRISKLGKNVIEAITLNGSNPNKKVLLHRMDMNPLESRWPFQMRRRQFPIQLSFAMTINKSQGQSLRHVGIYLSKPVFTHGQLYVALSRVRSMDGLKIYVPTNGHDGKRTITNVVYKEIFRNLNA